MTTDTPTTKQMGMTVTLDMPYEEAVPYVTTALKEEGFGVLTEIDVKATLKKKIDVDFQKYIILGACNPALAHKALSANLDIGLMLPCNVIVYEQGTGSVVSIVDPLIMLDVTDHPELGDVADDAKARLERVTTALTAK